MFTVALVTIPKGPLTGEWSKNGAVSLQWNTAAAAAAAKSLQSCPTLCDPIDGSPPGFSVHGIFQARVLEWGAIAFSYFATKRNLIPGNDCDESQCG